MRYKVLRPFLDKYSGTFYKEGDVFEEESERAERMCEGDDPLLKKPKPKKAKESAEER